MADIAEVLGRVTAGGPVLDGVGAVVSGQVALLRQKAYSALAVGNTGGGVRRPELTKADIAAALASVHVRRRLHDAPYRLGLLKFCGMDDQAGSVERHLWLAGVDLVVPLVRSEIFVAPRGSELIRMHARAALLKYLGECRCPTCHGAGSSWGKRCEPCHGTGELKLRQDDLAEASGMPRRTWRRNLKPVVDALIARLSDWENQVLWHAEERLRK